MPAMRVLSQRDDEFAVRERATAARLGQFRGEMGDVDFAHLVSEVIRLRDKGEGRQTDVSASIVPDDKPRPAA